MHNKGKILISALVFIVTFSVYVTSPVVTSYDSRWSIHTSLSILKEGNTNLNEYEEIIKKNDYYAIKNINGDLYTIFPIGASILAIPFVAVGDYLFPLVMSIFPSLESKFIAVLARHGKLTETLKFIDLYQPIELVIASVFCALTALVIFLIVSFQLSRPYALLAVFIFAFCTSSWSTSSRALWQHGPSMLMLALSLYLIILALKVDGVAKYVSIPLAIAFIVRPTNAIPIFFFTIYIWVNYKKQLIPYFFLSAPFVIFFFTYNILVYDALFPYYFSPNRVFHFDGNFSEAIVGNLISPSRGVFIYSPILLFGLVWAIFNIPRCSRYSLQNYILLTVFLHWILISSFPHWWAGHSYGPRFFADMVPFLIYLLAMFVSDFKHFRVGVKRLIIPLFSLFLVVSLYINAKGAYSRSVYKWNVTPNNIDDYPERLWDWSDLQFLR